MKLSAIVYPVLSRTRAVVYGAALFGLVVLGLHAGSDRLDDLAFIIIHGLDRTIDGIVAAILQVVLPVFGASADTVSRWAYAAASILDLEDQRWLARALALVFELTADALLVGPVLRYRYDPTPLSGTLAQMRPQNIGAVFGPIAVALAGLAGAVVVAHQTQLELFWMLRRVRFPSASFAAGVGAWITLGLVLWRLSLPALRAGVAYGQAQADKPPWYRGWWMTLPVIIAVLAVSPRPLFRTLRGLGPW